MTRMLPPTVHSSVVNSERKVYSRILRAKNSEDWACLHSLGLAFHPSKRRAEIDFLLVTREGVFVLEVKGGRVRRDAGVWKFIDARGNVNTKRESPFDQASSAMFALQSRIADEFGAKHKFANTLFGYGVVFPDIEFDFVGVEADPRQVYDIHDQKNSFDRYVARLTQFAREVDPRKRYGLKTTEIAELVDFLRGDFDLVPSFDYTADDLRRSLVRLTESQYATLDAIGSLPRVLVEGSAGTGKTMLAVEAARRIARSGREVLLLCFNVLLATRLRALLSDEPGLSIDVFHIHEYMRRVVEGSPIEEDFERQRRDATNETELFERLYPQAAALALSGDEAKKYDVLVVDEAQDLLSGDFVGVLDESLKHGIAEGCWRVFLDSNNQAGVYGRAGAESTSLLDRFSKTVILTENCRNTVEVATTAAILTKPKLTSRPELHGAEVGYTWYDDEEHLASGLNAALDELASQGVYAGAVVVLFPKRPPESVVKTLASRKITRLESHHISHFGVPTAPHAHWSTVSGFKGLESDVVVLAGIERLDSAWWTSVLYVGMSRARVRLQLVISEEAREEVEQMHSDYATTLAARMEVP